MSRLPAPCVNQADTTVGGRAVAAKYDLELPPYPGIEQIVELDAGEGQPSRM